MPASLSYPGVYVQEAPGAHAISGVSTSVAAFLGTAKRGPLNTAVPIFSFADFERAFGGLSADSELSYAVRLFFLNGGSRAYVVRIAAGAQTASLPLDAGGPQKLTFTALDGGLAGNYVKLVVTPNRLDPVNRFDLAVSYAAPDAPASAVSEQYTGLSMNSHDAAYVETAINGVSGLVSAKRAPAAGIAWTQGSSQSANDVTAAVLAAIGPTANAFNVVIDGGPPVAVVLPAGLPDAAHLASAIGTQLGAKATVATASVAVGAGTKTVVKIASAAPASDVSAVRVLPGTRNDAARLLGFGIANGGSEVDGAAAGVPVAAPAHGAVGGTAVTQPLTQNTGSVAIAVDGLGPDVFGYDVSGVASANAKLQAAVDQISAAVRARRPSNPGYAGFSGTLSADASPKVTFSSGSRGATSSVSIGKGQPAASDASTALGFAAPTPSFAADAALAGGGESPIDDSNRYATYLDTSAPKRGLYALENVDVFNLLCIPGVSDASVVGDAAAYALQRDAFYLVDPPAGRGPVDMQTLAEGPTLPKNDHAALYWPNIKIGDPLAGGALRLTAPSGAIAGVYARTDGARGIWKAPAGTDATVAGAQALEYNATDGENGLLNPDAVNCIRAKQPYGIIAWGARTMAGSDAAGSQYKYVPVRRLASYIKLSLMRGTQWVVFEPNAEPLWSQIRLSIGGFMDTLFRQGAFQGSSARDAYFVLCDRSTTTPNDAARGVVNIVVGFAPLKPAEFVVITLTQIAGQSA